MHILGATSGFTQPFPCPLPPTRLLCCPVDSLCLPCRASREPNLTYWGSGTRWHLSPLPGPTSLTFCLEALAQGGFHLQ